MAFALVGPPVAIHALVDLRVRILFLAVIEPFPAAVLALRKHVPGIEAALAIRRPLIALIGGIARGGVRIHVLGARRHDAGEREGDERDRSCHNVSRDRRAPTDSHAHT